MLPLSNPREDRLDVGMARQVDELSAEIFLERAAARSCPCRELVSRLVWHVPNRDRYGHAAIMMLALSQGKQVACWLSP